MSRLPFIFRSRHVALATAVAIACTAVAGFLFLHRERIPDERLLTPGPLLRDVIKQGKPLFLSPDLLPYAHAGSAGLIPSPEDSLQASLRFPEFLKLHRSHRFAAVLIGPDPAYSPVVGSLLTSPLWVLSDVTPWGYLFLPAGSRTWALRSEGELTDRWPATADRADWMIRTALCLSAIGRNTEAEELLRSAEATHLFSSRISSTRASLAASRGDWENALTLSRKALRQDRSNRGAREILIRCLTECGRGDEALDQARELTSLPSPDERSLFLLARAANAAGSQEEEIVALQRLVALQRKRNGPTGATLAYLGQACAKNGRRGEALRAFAEALTAAEMTEEQRGAIREVVDHLAVKPAASSPRKQEGNPSLLPSTP